MVEFPSKIRGVTFGERQRNIQELVSGQKLFWKHTPENKFDVNATLVYADEGMTKEIGHINKKMAKFFVKRMEAGILQELVLTKVTGGEVQKDGYKRPFGVNFILRY